MIEATTDTDTKSAIAAAHEARGAAVRDMFAVLRNLFKGSEPKSASAALAH